MEGLDEEIVFEDPKEWGARHEEQYTNPLHRLLSAKGYDVRCRIEYVERATGRRYKLEDLQNRYGYGFGQSELWEIIERAYESVTIMTWWDNRYVPQAVRPGTKNT